MTATINASTSSGVVVTSDTSGALALQTANTTAMTIDSSQNATFNSTGALAVPSGTTAQRPASPVNGQIRYNTTTSQTEIYQGGAWNSFISGSATTVTYLVVGGGGGAGADQTSDPAGGGGAGGYRSGTLSVAASTLYNVTVGGAGTGGSFPNVQTRGIDSTFSTITSAGGGGGGNGSGASNATTTYSGLSGGSGGGSGFSNGTAGVGGSATSGQGNSGATNITTVGGGGGGSSAAGSGQSGGAGTSNSITGSAVTYAAGGSGGSSSSGAGSAGANNTGNGGTAGWNTAPGPNGGSGIVVISYPSTYKAATITGTVTQATSGGNYIYTFTGNGTITF